MPDWSTVVLTGSGIAETVLSAPQHAARQPVESSRRVAVLGSTGSIGRSTLSVIGDSISSSINDSIGASTSVSRTALRAVALSGHRNLELLRQQVDEFRPRWVVVTDPELAASSRLYTWPPGTELLTGTDGIEFVVTRPEVDVVLSAIVGSAGLRGTWAALEARKPVALANKESLVVAGPLVMELARQSGVPLLPVDSEHSAIFQALQAGRRHEVRRVVLTASGGPFRHYSSEQLAGVTVQDALAHPTWSMGTRITIDSATMMNKALEIIEARWLFDLRPEQIAVVIHPQSIVHSMVEFVDGSVIAQLSPPDMRLPIQYALSWPQRCPGPAAQFDWSQVHRLEFHPPDFDRFDALRLGFEVAQRGGTTGAVLNAANETAVAAFLAGQIGFHEIVPICRTVLEHHTFDPSPTLDQLFQVDRWAREVAGRWTRR